MSCGILLWVLELTLPRSMVAVTPPNPLPKLDQAQGTHFCILFQFSKATTNMAYTDFVNNFLDAIDTFRAVCKNNTVFAQFVQVSVTHTENDIL